MRKLMIILSAIALLLTLPGCTGDEYSSGQLSGNPDAEGDGIYEIVMQYPTLGEIPQDLKLVEAAVNARTEPEIGVRVVFVPVSVFDLASTTNIMFSWGDKLDIIMCGFGVSLADYVNKGMLIELDDLVAEYGQSIVDAEGIAMSGGYFRGSLYALPAEEKMGRVRALYCRRDILDKYGIDTDPTTRYTMDEISEIFAKVRVGENEDFYCLATNINDDGFYSNFDIVDKLGSTLASGCLMNYGSGTTEIVNYFATDKYEQACRMIRGWYQNGYLNPDCNIVSDAVFKQMQSGNYFAFFNSAEPDMLIGQNTMLQGYVDTELAALYTSYPNSVTQNFRISMWGITSSCAEPIKAMRWLNMLWQDTEISNLLNNGIEGLHYQFVDDGPVIQYLDGMDASTTRYKAILNVWGDKSKMYIWEPLDESYYRDLDEFNNFIWGVSS